MYREEFQKRLEKAKKEEALLKRENDRFINIRTILFIALVAALGYFLLNKQYQPALWSAAVFVLAFIVVVVRHNGVKSRLKSCQMLIVIHENNLKRMDGGWSDFSDKGDEFLSSEHPYAADLNIFGPKSLFQLINQTHTYLGRQRLSELLGKTGRCREEILKRQGAVKELSQKLDLSEQLMLQGLLFSKNSKNPESLLNTFRETPKVSPILKSPLILYGLPCMTILSAAFAGRTLPWLFGTLLAGIILQLLLFLWSFLTVNPILSLVNQYKSELGAYRRLIELLERQTFSDGLLKELQQALLAPNARASKEIKRISVISDYIDFKYSPLIYFILNALFLWDLQLFRAFERWQKANATKVGAWLQTLAEFEALESLAVMGMITPVQCYPVITEGKPALSAGELSHPYLHYEKRVPNDVELKGVGIITGSNMSGKTTLLRTVGTNLVLALAGAPVCAKTMSTSVLSLLTSMRNQDDLNEGISTFYAELLRIKKIVDYSKKQEGMLFLIDEIFKGTNSKDRIEGAKIVLRGLNKPWAIGFISTHDYELCDLEAEDALRFCNLHFTETYADGQIHFDYLLHRGRCRTSNARFLMKMVGLE
ncbi:MAG: MutS family DNA mismatch repair protein [Clostridia bacterium]|nr:MutS family DNA mismatch repair protein [Clostridia bacterium]